MGPPRSWMNTAIAVATESFDDFVITARLLAVFVIVIDRHHFDSVVRMPANLTFDVITIPIQLAGRDRQVFLEHLANLELHAHFPVRQLILGDEDDAAGIPVKTVNDAGPMVAVKV